MGGMRPPGGSLAKEKSAYQTNKLGSGNAFWGVGAGSAGPQRRVRRRCRHIWSDWDHSPRNCNTNATNPWACYSVTFSPNDSEPGLQHASG